MHFGRTTSTAAFLLVFGAIVPVYAQQDRKDEKQGKPEKQQSSQKGAPPAIEKQRPQGRPQGPQGRGQDHEKQSHDQQRGQPDQQPQRVHQTQHQPPQQQQVQRSQPAQQQPHRTQQQAVAWQQQRGWLQQGGWQGQDTWQQGRAQQWEREHRTWVQRGGYGGYYIPQDRFSLYFGREHWFRMHHRPVIYMGYPRFEYSGYSFLLVDPWPEYWSENWYEADDVYIDYDDGYYLSNRRYPRVRLAITVVM